MPVSPHRVAEEFLTRKGASEAQSLLGLLGCLTGLSILHQTTHWQIQGIPAYGDHLLFERLYTGIDGEIDILAEKMVQLYGPAAVAPLSHLRVAEGWISRWLPETDPVGRSLGAERDFQRAIRSVYDDLKDSGELSLGLDDFLMSTANSHETNLYLLQQRMGGIINRQASRVGGIGNPDLSAEGHFFDKPRTREVREFAQSNAISNDFGIAAQAVRSNEMGQSLRQVRRDVDKSPLTVPEILQLPGGEDFATLNRYVVETKVKTDKGIPQSHDEIPKHPDILVR